MEVLEKLKEYINENRGAHPPVTDIDEALRLDSLGFIRTVAFLENHLGVKVEDDEYTADNFATLRTISEFIAAKSKAGKQPESTDSA
jgi:acyl carrier protein